MPPGSAPVRMSGCPAAGPWIDMGVAPVIRRFSGEVFDDAPLTPVAPRDLDHGEPVGGHLDVAHLARPLGLAVPGGPGELGADVLVIHAEEAPGGRGAAPRERHEADEVVVAAELALLLRRRLGLGVELHAVGEDRVAPAEEHAVRVARRQDQLVLRGGHHRGERERRLGFRAARGEPSRRERGQPRGAAGEEPPPGHSRRQDRLEGRVRARVDRAPRLVREVVIGPLHGRLLSVAPRQGLRCRASARNESRLWAGRNASTCGSAACMPWVSGW